MVHPHEFCLKIEVAWLTLELANIFEHSDQNMRSAKVVFMRNHAKQVNESGGNLWSKVAPLRRGAGSKQLCDVPTPALLDKDGFVFDIMPAIQ